MGLRACDLREALDQLVAVHRTLAEEQEERRLHEPLDARPYCPVARPDEGAGAPAMTVAAPHPRL
jgi:hypothetical protein